MEAVDQEVVGGEAVACALYMRRLFFFSFNGTISPGADLMLLMNSWDRICSDRNRQIRAE